MLDERRAQLMAILAEPHRARDLPARDAAALAAELATAQAALAARATEALTSPPCSPSAREEDRLLTPRETAAILGVKPRWLYTHANKLPFARRLSRKVLRFEEAGLRRWLTAHRPRQS